MTNSKSRLIRMENRKNGENYVPMSQAIVANEVVGGSLVESVSVRLRLTKRDGYGIERDS